MIEKTPPSSADVVVVGAGPTGLTLACELARRGVRVRIIDKAATPATTSRALAIFPRTLEIFAAMGIAESVIEAGQKLLGVSVHGGEGLLAHIGFENLPTRYPFALGLRQSQTEQFLAERLRSLGVEVERGTELTVLEPTPGAVRAVLRHEGAREEPVSAPWLIGCDGARSSVRQQAGIPFEGGRMEEEFILADVRVEGPFSSDAAHLFFSQEGVFALFPLGEGRGRVIANVPPGAAGDRLPTLGEIQELARQRGVKATRLGEPEWFSRFHIAQRMVRDYRQGRVFLAGDAAHIHSPAGGQGMNTGIQDAFNLAWKLALVIKGEAGDALLESYTLERRPVAREVLRLTERLTRLATVRNPVNRRLRNFFVLLAASFSSVEGRIALQLSELAVHYRGSPIVAGVERREPFAGTLAPDATLYEAESGKVFSISDLYHDPRHHLLLFRGENVSPQRREAEPEWLGRYRSSIAVWEIGVEGEAPLRDRKGEAHQRFGAQAGAIILLRPDGYIGFRSELSGMEDLRVYLAATLT